YPSLCATGTTLYTAVNHHAPPSFPTRRSSDLGAAIPALPTTSTNGITGTWAPAINNTQTTTYTFTPDAGQCAVATTLEIVVNNNVTRTFASIAVYCSGRAIPAFPTTSTNGITD